MKQESLETMIPNPVEKKQVDVFKLLARFDTRLESYISANDRAWFTLVLPDPMNSANLRKMYAKNIHVYNCIIT